MYSREADTEGQAKEQRPGLLNWIQPIQKTQTFADTTYFFTNAIDALA
jgi:hypothetical protein